MRVEKNKYCFYPDNSIAFERRWIESMKGDQQSPRYHHQEGWGKIQSLFPASHQLNHANLPKVEWYGWKENRIHLDRYEVKQSAVKLIIFHGGGGYGRLLAPCGIMAQQSGYEAVVPDLPGYGLTQVPDKDALLYQDWVDFAIDFIRAEQQRDSRPIVLFGASMGGLLAYEAAAHSRIPVGIAATCLLDPQDPQVRRAVSLYSWMGSLIGPLFKVGRPLLDPMRIPMRWIAKMNAIANDPKIAKMIAKDPLGGGT